MFLLIRHMRRKVLNIWGGGEQGSEYWGGGGARGAKLFAGCKLTRAPASNQYQIITFLTLKTDNIAYKLRIALKSILLEIPSNKIKGTYIKLVHLWYTFYLLFHIDIEGNVGGLFWGQKGMCPPPSKIIGGPGPPAPLPLFLRLCKDMFLSSK